MGLLERVAQAGKGKRSSRGVGLGEDRGAGLDEAGALAQGGGEPGVFFALAFARFQAADDAQGCVADHAWLDGAGGLFGSDQDEAEAAAAFGDVEEHFFDGVVALARGVFVEFVDEQVDGGGWSLGVLSLSIHALRRAGNDVVHGCRGDKQEAP